MVAAIMDAETNDPLLGPTFFEDPDPIFSRMYTRTLKWLLRE